MNINKLHFIIFYNKVSHDNNIHSDGIDNIEFKCGDSYFILITLRELDVPLHIIDHRSVLYLTLLQTLLYNQQYDTLLLFTGSGKDTLAVVTMNNDNNISHANTDSNTVMTSTVAIESTATITFRTKSYELNATTFQMTTNNTIYKINVATTSPVDIIYSFQGSRPIPVIYLSTYIPPYCPF